MRILIPEHIYVGSMPKHKLCSVTAWGTDSSAKGRITTVQNNSGGEKNCSQLVNEPMVGFKMVRSAYKDIWILWDPRGFEFYIQNHLLDTLIHDITIVRGEIQEPCVYARVDGQNILLGTHTEMYQRAVAATEVAESKANWKDTKPGNQVTLRSGVKGTYMGKYQVLVKTSSRYHDSIEPGPPPVGTNKLQTMPKPMHVIHEVGPKGWDTIHLLQNPQLARIDAQTHMNAVDAEIQANQLLNAPKTQINHTMGYGMTPLLLSMSKTVTHVLSIESITPTLADVVNYLQDNIVAKEYSLPNLCRLDTGELLRIYNIPNWKGYVMSEPHLQKSEFRHIMEHKRNASSHSGWYDEKVMNTTPTNIVQVYELHLKHVSDLGNTFDVIIA